MSHNALETDEFPATIPVTDIGDTTYPETEEDMGTRLARRTRYLLNSIAWNFGSTDAATFDSEAENLLTSLPHPGARLGALNFFSQIAKPLVGTVKYLSNRIVGLSDTPKKVFVPLSPINMSDNDWAFAEIGGKGVISQIEIGGSAALHFDLPVPLGGFLRNVTMWSQAGTGITHAGPVGTKPAFAVSQISSQAGGFSATALGSATDPSGTVEAYDALHSTSLDLATAMTQTLSSGALLGYRIRVTGESGANAIGQGFCICAITATFARGGG